MNDELQYAVQQEVLALLGVSGGTAILHTNFNDKSWPTYIMPLILISIDPGDLNQQFLGGVEMVDWQVSFSAYAHRPDISGLDPTGNSAANTRIIDTVRRHFSNFAVFVATEMAAIQNKYGFRWTWGGLAEAETLEHPDGLCYGKKIIFNAVGLDDDTAGTTTGPNFDPANLSQAPPFPAGIQSSTVDPADPRTQLPPYPSYGSLTRQ